MCSSWYNFRVMINFRNQLNENQYRAVTTTSQYVRVVAGAGSGKTRVLTYRIAYLIEEMQVFPWKILAFTFTNKVAAEMKERAIKLVGDESRKNLDISTYHKFCAMFLRREISVIGYSVNFSIIDETDQKTIVKNIAESHGLKRTDEIVDQSLDYIRAKKGAGLYPQDINVKDFRNIYPNEKICLEYFKEYEVVKSQMSALDFDDLILKTIQILESQPDILSRWKTKYSHILIDEFQDTNDVEYKLIKLLLNPETCLYVVGDPDQTIYTWRGANQKIIVDMDKLFPSVETIILDENYRSTKQILSVTNKLISHNKYRLEKNLVTNNKEGEPVVCHNLGNRKEEARWVVSKISELKQHDSSFLYKDVAILYRAAYVSLEFENALSANQIRYIVYGGIRFYQRSEIKNALSYFRLIVNPNDDLAFYNIINFPRRNIGDSSIKTLRLETETTATSVYEYIKNIDKYKTSLRSGVVNSLSILVKNIDAAKSRYDENLEATVSILDDYLKEIDYYEDRVNNVRSLLDNIKDYFKNEDNPSLDIFLQNASLQTSQDEIKDADVVKLMTVHTAKGLEFKYVFVVGLNQDVFPSRRTVEESPIFGMEEERRLCYVAFTRAMEKLFVSCNHDYSFVNEHFGVPSIFISEAGLEFYKPKEAPQSIRNRPPFTERHGSVFTQINKEVKSIDWKVGDYCHHKTFGDGEVVETHGDIIKVNFDNLGLKSLIGTHPFLEKIENKGGKA